MAKRKNSENIYALQYWPTWLGLGLLRLLSIFPLRVLHWLGGGIGLAVFHLHKSRRRIAYTNLKSCFPEQDDSTLWLWVKNNFRHIGRGVMCTGFNWYGSGHRLDRLCQAEGREIIDGLIAEQRRVILLAPHFIALEPGGMWISRQYPTISMYQIAKNRCTDHAIRKGRTRYGGELYERGGAMRTLVRRIRQGRLFYYLPDQDPGRREGVFVPFFGIQTATFPTLSRFARMSNAVVVPVVTRQLEHGQGWCIRFYPPIENFPGSDEIEDTERMNAVIEALIRELPDQYFWVHKRFKSRPEGEPPFYD